jgi:hypothetical protein
MMVERQAVGRTLLVWERLGLAKDVDADLIDAFTAIMQGEAVNAAEWDFAALEAVKRTKFVIKPADVLGVIDDYRARNYRNPVDGYRECLDEHGFAVLAPPERILHGRLLPPGKRNPNPQNVDALPSPPLTAEARRERVTRMAKDFGADCATRFVAILSAGGVDVSTELEIVKQARQAEDAERERDREARRQVLEDLRRREAAANLGTDKNETLH